MSQEAKGVMDCKGRVKFSFQLADKITPGEITKEYTNKIKRLILKFIEKRSLYINSYNPINLQQAVRKIF